MVLTADLALQALLAQIVPALKPKRVYLFGSRANGNARTDSDYDLLVIAGDTVARDQLRLTATWQLAKAAKVPADIFACYPPTFAKYADVVGTLPYTALHQGQVIYEA